MRTYNQWMDDYGASHKNPTNVLIHKICVPLIMLSAVGLFWVLPIPAFFKAIPYLNWATIFLGSSLAFYLSLNLKMFLGMIIQSALMILICNLLNDAGVLFSVSLIIFLSAWAGQFYGHKLERNKPSFLEDLIFLLIGPLWVTRFLYQKIGINA